MELPPYRFPTFQGLLIHTWERTWQYIKKAGTVILAISILLWALMTYPALPDNQLQQFAEQRQNVLLKYQNSSTTANPKKDTLFNMQNNELTAALLQLERIKAEKTLRYSIAGRIGTGIESISSFAGFDWRTNIALLGGFAAKEVIISTLGTAYSLGDVDAEEFNSLKDRLKADSHWNPAVALSVLVFIMFYAPCFVTVVCIARESGTWKWAFFSMAFNTIFAFSFSVLIYQGSRILNLM
jgi:ferrous iron transport protein B